MKLVSIIVPMYNESSMVDDFFSTVLSITGRIKNSSPHYDFEIIAIDDGSTDDTLDKLTAWHNKKECVGVISLSRNFGQEPAIFAGLEKSRGDAVIVMDCDMQDPPEFIEEMLKKWEEGYDVVNARRTKRKADSAFKRDTAGMYYRLLNRLSYKVKYPHNVNNFRLVSRRVLDTVLSMPEKNKFYRGLVPYAGFKSAEILIERQHRLKGESKYNLKAMTRLAVDGITATSTKPLYYPLIAGLVMSATAVLAMIALLIVYLLKDYPAAFWAGGFGFASIAAIIFFCSGIILTAVGIVGVYAAKAYDELKGRPFNIVESYLPPANKDSDI